MESFSSSSTCADAKLASGFFQLPEHITDIPGPILADTGSEGRWWFRDFVDSPAPRYRAIVAKFQEREFVQSAKDEFESPQ